MFHILKTGATECYNGKKYMTRTLPTAEKTKMDYKNRRESIYIINMLTFQTILSKMLERKYLLIQERSITFSVLAKQIFI